MYQKLLFILLISSLSTAAFAQPSPVVAEKVYKEWQVLPDSKNMVEIFYCIVKCDGVNKINLMIFNDSDNDQDITVSLAITNNADNQHFSFSKVFSSKKGLFHKATCDSETLPELKIAIPGTYDPAGISVKQIF